jgi:hypothetical protein
MPGRKLNDIERNLLRFWTEPPANLGRPLLRQFSFASPNAPLRGIRSALVDLNFPLTVICGRNGAGKSSLLALLALSAKTPLEWPVHWGNARPRTKPGARMIYSFNDFFPSASNGGALDGLSLRWVHAWRGVDVEVVKKLTGSTWRVVQDAARNNDVSRGMVREIDFVPIDRVVPATDFNTLRNAFGKNIQRHQPMLDLDEHSLAALGYILGREYRAVTLDGTRGLSLPRCEVGSRYNGFNMGSGELSVISILARVQTLPKGGLLLIEEVELGLHAEAQIRLVEVLLRACRVKRLQIVCTTHSETVIDRVPRQARILIRRAGMTREALGGVSTRFAIHEMTGDAQPELIVYTEDKFASMMVAESITRSDRVRVSFRDVGSNSALARQAVAHLRVGLGVRAVALFDGDCTRQEIEGWINGERAERQELDPEWDVLPGDGVNPEAWVLNQLQSADYVAEFARELQVDVAVAQDHVEAMRVQLDRHHAARTLARRTSLDLDEAQRILIRSVVRRHPALDNMRALVARILG